MDHPFSLKASQLGKLVLSSGLLQSSWSKISKRNELTYSNQDSDIGLNQKKKRNDSALRIEIFEEAKCTFVVFAAPPTSRDSSFDSASTPFHFMDSEYNDSFSVHSPAFELFSCAYMRLYKLKCQLLQSKKPVIITGTALGGSVASLFTLCLLETTDPKPRFLCITFGSPLIGDASLQQILKDSVRESCFLHVADAARTPITAGFKPFGTFLICFETGCICIEDPEAAMELLEGANTDLVDYGEVLHRLDISVLSMADRILIPYDVILRMEERAWKKNLHFDLFKMEKHMNITMMHIEYYQKRCKEVKICYYDHYRLLENEFSLHIEMRKHELNDYWKMLVEELETEAHGDISSHRGQFLNSGNYYRRMIEPLDIAEYYRKGGKDYRTVGRSHHYVKLEKWSEKASIKPSRYGGSDLSEILTSDSCFWAEVEEALIVITNLKTHLGMRDEEREFEKYILLEKLMRFEEYIWDMIKNCEVSPDIFLEGSSFMKWWREYRGIKGKDGFNSSSSHFTKFMNSGMYQTYGLPSPNLEDHISGLDTGLRPGPSDKPKSSVDEEEGQKVISLKLHLRSDKEKNKAFSTISKISGRRVKLLMK